MSKNSIFETPNTLSNKELEYLVLSADKEKITKQMRSELKKDGENSLLSKIENEVGSYLSRADVLQTSKDYVYELYKRLCSNVGVEPKDKDALPNSLTSVVPTQNDNSSHPKQPKGKEHNPKTPKAKHTPKAETPAPKVEATVPAPMPEVVTPAPKVEAPKAKTEAPKTQPAPKNVPLPLGDEVEEEIVAPEAKKLSLDEAKKIYSESKDIIKSTTLGFYKLGFDKQNKPAIEWWKKFFESTGDEDACLNDVIGISDVDFVEQSGEGFIKFNLGMTGLFGWVKQDAKGQRVEMSKCVDENGKFSKDKFFDQIKIIANNIVSSSLSVGNQAPSTTVDSSLKKPTVPEKQAQNTPEVSKPFDLKSRIETLALKDFGGNFGFTEDMSKPFISNTKIVKIQGVDYITFKIFDKGGYKIKLDDVSSDGKFDTDKFKDKLELIFNDLEKNRNNKLDKSRTLGMLRQECDSSLNSLKITSPKMLFDDLANDDNKNWFSKTFGFDLDKWSLDTELIISKIEFEKGEGSDDENILVFDIKKSGIGGSLLGRYTKDLKINLEDLVSASSEGKPEFDLNKFMAKMKEKIQESVKKR